MDTLNRMSIKVALVLALLLAAPQVAFAVGEVNGRIEGTITEAQTGAPVPGATITFSGPALIGGPRTIASGDDGRYEAVELPPGRYDIQVSYAGVKPIRRRVVVRMGETVPLDIAWSPELAKEEVTVVQEERHMTRPDSTSTGTVLSADSESKVASQRDYQDIATQVAGVTDVDGGGNPQIKGGNLSMNKYLVDGLDITDPTTNTFSANINFDSIGSVQVLTGGMEAEYNSLGGVINLITNAGSDQFHVDSSIYINNKAFSAGPKYGSQLYNGVEPFATTNPSPSQSYQANLNVGGPILKHRLWYNASVEFDYTERSQPAGPPLNFQHPSRTYLGVEARLKLTWAPNDKHRITLSASADPAWIKNAQQDSFPANSILPDAENQQNQGGVFAIASWDYFHSQNVNTRIQTGFQYNHIDFAPMGILSSVDYGGQGSAFPNDHMYNPNNPQHFNAFDNTLWYNGASPQYDRRYTFQFDPSISVRGHAAGYHDAKFGIQSRYAYHTFENDGPPGGTAYTDFGGPLASGLCSADPNVAAGGVGSTDNCFQRTTSSKYSNNQWGYTLGAFAQDRWKPFKRLTILPGIRADWGITKNSLGQTVSNLWGIGPRIGFTVDLTGDQKTILSGFYGRSNEVMSLLAGATADYTAPSNTYQWDPTNKKFVFNHSSGGLGGYALDPTGNTPHADEVTAGIRREIFKDSVASVDYTWKHYANIWDGVETNQIWDPTGNRVVGYANGQAQQIFRYSRPDNNDRTYQGVDVSVESRPNEHWDVYAAYTLAWLYGPGAEEIGLISGSEVGGSAFYNPRMSQFFDGYLPEDVRHTLKGHASYNWEGLTLGANFTYQSGTPETKDFFNQNDGAYSSRRSPSGTDPGSPANNTSNISEFRTPDLMLMNVRVSYDFYKVIHQHLTLIADMFNLFNLRNATSIENTDVATYGIATARQTPFRFQIGARYQY